MEVFWALSALKEAYDNRETISTLLQGGLKALFGTKTKIAVTGLPGVGKSVLLDHLKGRQVPYDPPGQSQRVEHAKIKVKGERRRLALSVIPGQHSTVRSAAEDTLFLKQKLDGVIHVVPFGFASLRSKAAEEHIVAQGATTIRALRDLNLKAELDDLEETCSLLAKAHHTKHQPPWIVIAVDKVDLYVPEIEDAHSYYSPDSGSPFAEKLVKLRERVGSDFLRFDAAPVCAHPTTFTWNREVCQSALTEEERDAYLAQFLRLLASYAN
jgi:GTPase SAR1 family protein